LTYNMSRFIIRGSLSLATELVQTKRDLGRTRLAKEVRRRRRASKNANLQSGGPLRVENSPDINRQSKEDDIERARRLVEAADQKGKKCVRANGYLKRRQRRHGSGGHHEG
jgi:hypothetical protein